MDEAGGVAGGVAWPIACPSLPSSSLAVLQLQRRGDDYLESSMQHIKDRFAGAYISLFFAPKGPV